MCYNSFHKVTKSSKKLFQESKYEEEKKMKELSNVLWRKNNDFSIEGFRRRQKLNDYGYFGSLGFAGIWTIVVVVLKQYGYIQANIGVTTTSIVSVIILGFMAGFFENQKQLCDMWIAHIEKVKKATAIVKCIKSGEYSKLRLVNEKLQQSIFQQSIMKGNKGGAFFNIFMKENTIMIKIKGSPTFYISIFDDEKLLENFDID